EGARPAVRREDPSEELEERRLAGAIGSDERDPIPAPRHERLAPVHDLLAEALADSFDADRLGAAPGRLGEREVDRPGSALDLDPVDLLKRLDAALDLPRLCRLVSEPFDEPFALRDLAVLVPLLLWAPGAPSPLLLADVV